MAFMLSDFTDDQLAALFAVTPRTVRNWRTRGAPVAVRLALVLLGGNLSPIHPDWQGWVIAPDGRLCTPGGVCVTASQVSHMNMAFNERDLLRGDLRRLERRVADLTRCLPTADVIPFPNNAAGDDDRRCRAACISFLPESPPRRPGR